MTLLCGSILAISTQTSAGNIRADIFGRSNSFAILYSDSAAPTENLQQTLILPEVMRRFAQLARIYSRGYDSHEWVRNFTILESEDSASYREAMVAAHAGQNKRVQSLLRKIHDRVLAGSVLAELYLSLRHKPSCADLAGWLARYSALPQSREIYDLAVRLCPEAAAHFAAPSPQAPVQGNLAQGGSGFQAVTDLPEIKNKAVRFSGRKSKKPLQDFQGHKITSYMAWSRGLQAWRDKDWRLAEKQFAFVASSNIGDWDKAAGLFWQARALQALGQVKAARTILARSAVYGRTFYGMLARARLGMGLDFNWHVPKLDAAHLQAIAATAGGRRGLALLQIGESRLAVDELRRIPVRGDQRLADALIALAHSARLPALSLSLGSILKTDEGRPFDSALFPIPPWKAEAGTPEDRALAFAIMRHESGFNPTAVSSSGAHGLMQLLPRTAAAMAVKAKMDSEPDLFDPTVNMNLGLHYIDRLSEWRSIKDNPLLLTAAYNGGPGNLMRWLKVLRHDGDPLLFLETMPYRETRNYVQRVLSSYWAYRDRLALSQRDLRVLANSQPVLRDREDAVARNPGNDQAQRASQDRILLASQ